MDLHNYETGEFIRTATMDELKRSIDASTRDGGAGVIIVDGVRCYVLGEETTTTMKPNTYYSSDVTIEVYYVNQHGVAFVIASPDFSREGQYSRIDKIPADASEATAAEVALCDITLPDGIEEVTA